MASIYSLILFDLDGTLVDPAGAITGGISAALRSHDLPVPDDAVLDAMVGPPLVHSLTGLAAVPEPLIDHVVATYRAGYVATGIHRSRPYPGIARCVQALADDGAVVAVATQKPEWLAEELLSAQRLRHLFASVHGSPRNESVATGGKTPIIRAALERHAPVLEQAGPQQAVMIGDRSHDVEGAHANGVPCIGVAWGFAARGELEDAGADAVVHSAEELLEVLRGGL
ncbi:HAD hydrolase-like protein [Arthrobacter echini]|uniref:HAD hydrolase-like protein n=1 Tax=Arthrobacter echini TaxID=1529066 RepID=UPI001455F811|nr:HAD hydrolase-like protein [Arthrobacter echini]